MLGSRSEGIVAHTGALNISEPLGLGAIGNKVNSTFCRSRSKTHTYLLTYLLLPVTPHFSCIFHIKMLKDNFPV